MDLRLITASHVLMFICNTLGTTEVIQLSPSTVYTYSLAVSIKLSNMMMLAENPTYQTLGLRGRASITATQNCTTLIQVNSLEVFSSSSAVRSANYSVKKADSSWSPVSQVKNSKPGRFCYEYGRIRDYHADAGESQLGLCFQRSLLSHIQVTARSGRLPTYDRETDISGDCITKYVPHVTSNGTLGFKKTKYTAGCNNKIYFHFLSSADVIHMPTLESKLPTIDGEQECNVRVRHDKVVDRTQCEEEFLIHPFGNEADREAVKMTTSTDLRLVGTTKTVTTVSLNVGQLRATTLFMSKQSFDSPKRNLSAPQMVSSLGFPEATKMTPRLFHDLMRQLRGLSQASLQRLKAELSQVNHPEEFRQAFLDGMAHLLPKYQLPVEMDDNTLIDSKEAAKFLSVKLNSFKDRPVPQMLDQESETTFNDLVDVLLSNLTGYCSRHPKGDVDRMLVTVSDLSQIGEHLSTQRFLQVISACLRLPSDDVTTRVAIGQLLGDLKCHPDLDAFSWNLLRNPQEDIETRIHFYRAYLKCPTKEKLVKMLALLERELSEQFQSYVSSHLVNSLSTTAHYKEHFRRLLKPFKTDIQIIGRRMWNSGRSFSKHYEYVYRTEKAAIGFQAHIIFGPESYIPRSIWVNLTLELFGHAFNLVEVSCRSNELQKFERWLASMRQQVFDTQPLAPPTRYDEFNKLFEHRSRPPPVTSVSVRVSGKTLLLWQNVTQKLRSVNIDLTNINHLLVNLKSDGHNLLLDSVIQISTVGGLPLYLNYILSVIDRSNIYTELKRQDQTIEGNWTFRPSLSLGCELTVNGHISQFGYSFWHDVTLSGGASFVLQHLSNSQSVKSRLLLKDCLAKERSVFQYRRGHYNIINGKAHEMPSLLRKFTTVYQIPSAMERVLGLSLKSVVLRNEGQNSIDGASVILHHFKGIHMQMNLDRGPSVFGPFKSVKLLIGRPDSITETRPQYLDVQLQDNQFDQFGHRLMMAVSTPWSPQLSINVTIDPTGEVSANGLFSEYAFRLYGAFNQHKFSGRLEYGNETRFLVSWKKIDSKIEFKLKSLQPQWPFAWRTKQISIVSEDKHYPMFRRLYHKTAIHLSDNQNATLTAEWNTGDGHGLMRRLVFSCMWMDDLGVGQREISGEWGWRHGDEFSQLAPDVLGYANLLDWNIQWRRGEVVLEQVAMQLRQFMSRSFWLQHSGEPAVASLQFHTDSPTNAALNLNSSAAWIHLYRVDQGGRIDGQVMLKIPFKEIDALAQLLIAWKGQGRGESGWLQECSAFLLLRVFPERVSRYLRVGLQHQLRPDVTTTLVVQTSQAEEYKLKSWLPRGRNLHRLTISFPGQDREYRLVTRFKLQFGYQTLVNLEHLLEIGEAKSQYHAQTELVYNAKTGQLSVQSILSSMTGDDQVLPILGFAIATESRWQYIARPFNLDVALGCRLELAIPEWAIEHAIDTRMALSYLKGNSTLQFKAVKQNSIAKTNLGTNILLNLDRSFGEATRGRILFKVYLSKHTPKGDGCELWLESLVNHRLLTLNCDKDQFGSLVLSEKFRWKPKGVEGSLMLSIDPVRAIGQFTGVYSNNNYVVYWVPGHRSIDFQGEYTHRFGRGPGSPIRIALLCRYNKAFTLGVLEAIVNSQLLGYWTNYEMISSLINYSLGSDRKAMKIGSRNVSVDVLIGYRLLEGRGTRGWQVIVQSESIVNEGLMKLHIQAGRPGIAQQNSLSMGYIFARGNYAIWKILSCADSKILEIGAHLTHNESLRKTNAGMLAKVAPLDFMLQCNESLQYDLNNACLQSSTHFYFSNPKHGAHYFNKTLSFQREASDVLVAFTGQLIWNSSFDYLASGSIHTKATQKRLSNGTIVYPGDPVVESHSTPGKLSTTVNRSFEVLGYFKSLPYQGILELSEEIGVNIWKYDWSRIEINSPSQRLLVGPVSISIRRKGKSMFVEDIVHTEVNIMQPHKITYVAQAKACYTNFCRGLQGCNFTLIWRDSDTRRGSVQFSHRRNVPLFLLVQFVSGQTPDQTNFTLSMDTEVGYNTELNGNITRLASLFQVLPTLGPIVYQAGMFDIGCHDNNRKLSGLFNGTCTTIAGLRYGNFDRTQGLRQLHVQANLQTNGNSSRQFTNDLGVELRVQALINSSFRHLYYTNGNPLEGEITTEEIIQRLLPQSEDYLWYNGNNSVEQLKSVVTAEMEKGSTRIVVDSSDEEKAIQNIMHFTKEFGKTEIGFNVLFTGPRRERREYRSRLGYCHEHHERAMWIRNSNGLTVNGHEIANFTWNVQKQDANSKYLANISVAYTGMAPLDKSFTSFGLVLANEHGTTGNNVSIQAELSKHKMFQLNYKHSKKTAEPGLQPTISLSVTTSLLKPKFWKVDWNASSEGHEIRVQREGEFTLALFHLPDLSGISYLSEGENSHLVPLDIRTNVLSCIWAAPTVNNLTCKKLISVGLKRGKLALTVDLDRGRRKLEVQYSNNNELMLNLSSQVTGSKRLQNSFLNLILNSSLTCMSIAMRTSINRTTNRGGFGKLYTSSVEFNVTRVNSSGSAESSLIRLNAERLRVGEQLLILQLYLNDLTKNFQVMIQNNSRRFSYVQGVDVQPDASVFGLLFKEADVNFTYDKLHKKVNISCVMSTSIRRSRVVLLVDPTLGDYATGLCWNCTANLGLMAELKVRPQSIVSRLNSPRRNLILSMNRSSEAAAGGWETYLLDVRDPSGYSANRYFEITKRRNESLFTIRSNLLKQRNTLKFYWRFAKDDFKYGLGVSSPDEGKHQIADLGCSTVDNRSFVCELSAVPMKNRFYLRNEIEMFRKGLHSECQVHGQNYSEQWFGEIKPWTLFTIKNKANSTLLRHYVGYSGGRYATEHIVRAAKNRLRLSHSASLSLSPLRLDTHGKSLVGDAWAKLNHVSGKDLRLELTHQRLGGNLQMDLVAYAYIEPNNTIQLDLDWNPDLWEIFILNSTNLVTRGYVREIAEDAWQALVDVVTSVFVETRSEIEKLFDVMKVQSLYHDLLLDLRAFSETLRRWREKDEFYLQTWNVTLFNNMIDADIVRLDKSVRSSILKQVNDVRASFKHLNMNNKWIDNMISQIKREIINRRYLNIRPILRKILQNTNATRINLEKLTKSAFHQAASGVFAVYRIRLALLNWFSEIQQSTDKVLHDLLTNVLYKVSSRMLTDSVDLDSIMTVTQDLGTIINWALETGVSFYRVMLTKQYLRDNESDRMLTLINNGEFNEAYRNFFKSERNYFMYDLDKGILRFGVHLPHLLKEWYEAASTLTTLSRRATSYIFPRPGILSLMYTYDQYQRRFDVLRKLPKMLPPYSVMSANKLSLATAWIMLGETGRSRIQVMTFNGGYLSIRRPKAVTSRTNSITYLLLRNTAGRGEIRCTLSLADQVWLLGFEVDRLHLQMGDNKTVSQRINNSSSRFLTLPYTVREGQHVISLHRQIDRLHMDLRRRQGKDEMVLLLSIVVDFNLRQLEFTLSGWWHGKCDGLLGRHGFDKLLDRIGPEWSEHVNRSRVAELWAYSIQGYVPMAVRTRQVNSTNTRQPLHQRLRVQCLNYFKKQSSCAFAVPPASWMDACLDMVWLLGGSNDSIAMQRIGEHVCRIAKAYTRACNLKDIPIRVPGKCIHCYPDMRTDGSRKYIVPETGEKRLHISFVLQLGECFSERIEEIKELLFRLQRGKLQSIRYSAILYDKFQGLPEISWVTSESGSTTILSSDTLIEALKSVYGTLTHEVNHNESISIDSDRALEALLTTIRQPVTLEAVKETILLFTCDRCSVSIPQDYGKVHRMLSRKGITFHYLPYTSFVKFGGFSSTTFMLTSDNLIGELRAETVVEGPNAARVVLPKDQCSIIAENSNGFIWAYRSVVKSDYMKRRTVLTSLASHLLQWQILPKLCHCRDNMRGDGVIDCFVKP